MQVEIQVNHASPGPRLQKEVKAEAGSTVSKFYGSLT